MTKSSVSDVLRELAKSDKNRSETARLREVISVEAALSAGVSRSAVLEALHGQGFTMTMKSFESALYRIRKQCGKGAKRNQSAPVPAPLHQGDDLPPSGPESSEESGQLTMRQRGEAVADKYMTASANPLLGKITKEKK